MIVALRSVVAPNYATAVKVRYLLILALTPCAMPYQCHQTLRAHLSVLYKQ